MPDSDQQPPQTGPTEVESTGGETSEGEKTWTDLKERYIAHPEEGSGDPGAETPVAPKGKMKLERSTLLIAGGVLALIVIVFLFTYHPKPKLDYDDLGAGVSNASGLKGHLITRWKGQAQYQLDMGPIDPREGPGFARVLDDPPQPLSINIRILDSSGFALCGKEILLPYYPGGAGAPGTAGLQPDAAASLSSNARKQMEDRQANLELLQVQEQDRERGKDVFQNKLGSEGEVASMSAQGVLPCSADQYKHFDYWDFSTNFPTMDQQDELLKHPRKTKAQQAAEERRAAHHAAKPQSAFYIEGDDTVSGYDTSSGALETSENRVFYIGRKSDQSAAAAWASSFAHIHYKCDQHATCALQRAGTSTVITGRFNE
ncbi:MAG TPA: hypothetical protein VFE01_11245 [Terracidiphilus sp.]|jgi:hypothetical protein|nr:hypothetical protein [Terracidiphilus sp.]